MTCLAQGLVATVLVFLSIAPAAAQSRVSLEVEGGASLLPAHAYLFRPTVDRTPPRPLRERLGPLVPVASLRVLFATRVSIRAAVEMAPRRDASESFGEIVSYVPNQPRVRSSSELTAGYHTFVLQPAVELAPRARVRPWVGAGLSLRWFDEQQTDTVVEVATGASSSSSTHRREREKAFVTSGGVRVDLSPRWFVAGTADVRVHRLGVSYNPDISPRSSRVEVLTTIGARF